MQSIPMRIIIALVSSAFTWWVFVKFGEMTHAKQPMLFASILIGSVFVHEVGHMVAFARHKVSSMLFILVIMGGTVPLDLKKESMLSDNQEAEIFLAGFFGNVLIMCAAMAAFATGMMSHELSLRIVNLNAGLILFNMLPFATLDGSRFVQLLFHNISPNLAEVLFRVTSIPVVVALMLLLYLKGSPSIALPLILFGLYRKKHAATNGGPRKPMNRTQRIIWSIVYSYMAISAILIYYVTPDWMH